MSIIKKSTQVAVGGLSSALCLLIMFMTGLIPFATYALPAMAGIVLIAVVIENGVRTSVLVYLAVSILSVFIVPDREAAVMFIFFFGYYPIIKSKLERIKPRLLEYLVKLSIFNFMIVLSYMLIIYVMGMPDILSELGEFGKYSAYILLGLGNVVFLIYDFALTNIIALYVNWFRIKVLRRI